MIFRNIHSRLDGNTHILYTCLVLWMLYVRFSCLILRVFRLTGRSQNLRGVDTAKTHHRAKVIASRALNAEAQPHTDSVSCLNENRTRGLGGLVCFETLRIKRTQLSRILSTHQRTLCRDQPQKPNWVQIAQQRLNSTIKTVIC